MEKVRRNGLFWYKLSEVYGGLNLDLFYHDSRRTSKIKSSGFAAAMWAHSYLAMTHLNAEGDERIKQDYLVPSIAGDKVGALCITEPYGGSDVAGMRTTAVRKGINMLSMDQNIYYEWCLCGLLYCCRQNKR
jgi:alkylation response protein AidB-like acyl-CoA dehydrogenase